MRIKTHRKRGSGVALWAWLGSLFLSISFVVPGGAAEFSLVEDGKPVAALVIGEALAREAKLPLWRAGQELTYEGDPSIGLGRARSVSGFRKSQPHPWSQAGVRAVVEDFNRYLEASTGTTLPVLEERQPGQPAIVFQIREADLLEDDRFEIEFPNDLTMQISGSPRSIRWAINHLLEKSVGVRWLSLNQTEIPQRNQVRIPVETIERTASFPLLRDPGYYRPNMLEYYLGLNAKFRPLPRSGLHAMTRDVFPLEKYAPDQSWPEAIMPVRGGKKLVLPPPRDLDDIHNQLDYTHSWHPCFSNPATVQIAVENILALLASEPDRSLIGLGVMDKGGHCRCPDCLENVGDQRNAMGLEHYSDLYFAWANQVVTQVVKKYPDVLFDLFAYREVFNPPSFDLHPSIIPWMTIDLYQLNDPEVAAEKWRQIEAWAARSNMLGIYDYGWGINAYALPRIYNRKMADFLKRFHALGGRGAEYGGWLREGGEGEGPKNTLFMKLLWDIDLDPGQVINEWLRDTVGAAAAPYLAEYFDFWESYWAGERIRRTDWYRNSINSQYMRWREWDRNPGTHTFALEQGDMARLRQLMETVVEKAGTPEQKARAERLMLAFSYYEANALGMFAEILPPEGKISNEAMALAIIEAAPQAFAAVERRPQIEQELFGTPPLYIREFNLSKSLLEVFQGVAAFESSARVRSALESLRDHSGLNAAQQAAVEEVLQRGRLMAASRERAPEIVIPRRSSQAFKLDGQLDDAFWQDVPSHSLVDAKRGKPGEIATRFQAAWAEDGLYLGIHGEEPGADGPVSGTKEPGDRAIFEGDTFEILLDTGTNSYYQLVISPEGALVDLDRSRGLHYDWSSGAQVATRVGDGFWSAEIRLPIDSTEEFDPDPDLGVIGSPPSKESPWHFNVARTRKRDGKSVTSVFSSPGSNQIHAPETFGRLILTTNESQ
jgi:hypothetical protein